MCCYQRRGSFRQFPRCKHHTSAPQFHIHIPPLPRDTSEGPGLVFETQTRVICTCGSEGAGRRALTARAFRDPDDPAPPRGARAPAPAVGLGVHLHEDEEGPVRAPQHLRRAAGGSPSPPDGTGLGGGAVCPLCVGGAAVCLRAGGGSGWTAGCGEAPRHQVGRLVCWGGRVQPPLPPDRLPRPRVHCGCPHWLSAVTAKVRTSQRPLPVLFPNPQRLLPCLLLRTVCVSLESHV